MFDFFKKNLFTAVGLAMMTRDKVEEAGKKIAHEAKLSEIEGKQFLEELLKKTDDTRMAIEKIVNDNVEIVLKKLEIPTRTEFNSIEKRLSKLESNKTEREKD